MTTTFGVHVISLGWGAHQDHIGAITSNAVMAACAAGHAWAESVNIFWDAWPVGYKNS